MLHMLFMSWALPSWLISIILLVLFWLGPVKVDRRTLLVGFGRLGVIALLPAIVGGIVGFIAPTTPFSNVFFLVWPFLLLGGLIWIVCDPQRGETRAEQTGDCKPDHAPS